MAKKKSPSKKKDKAADKAAEKTTARPASVPADAVFVAKDDEWEIGARKGTKQVGDFTWWRADGTLVCRSHYDDDGKLHGVCHRHHPDGSISLESRYVHGIRWGKTRHTRSVGGGSPEDVHMSPVPDFVFELAMAYRAGEVLPTMAMQNELGAKKPPKSHLGWLEDFAEEIPKFV